MSVRDALSALVLVSAVAVFAAWVAPVCPKAYRSSRLRISPSDWQPSAKTAHVASNRFISNPLYIVFSVLQLNRYVRVSAFVFLTSDEPQSSGVLSLAYEFKANDMGWLNLTEFDSV